MSWVTVLLIWIACGYGSILYAAVTGWWAGEDQTLQDLLICCWIAPFAGGLLLFFVIGDMFKALGRPITKWFEKETVLVKGRNK